MVDAAAGLAVIDAQNMPARAQPGLDAGQGKQNSPGFSSPNGFIPFPHGNDSARISPT
jgi:hypothetical protein